MWPRNGRHGGNRVRLVAALTAVGITAAGISGCGGGAAKAAESGPDKGTYVNGSSPEEYCSVLENAKARLGVGVESGDDAMLSAIHTINDIEPLAPEETKPDWSAMRMVMRAVVEANGSDKVGMTTRAEAGEVYAELSGRVSDSVADICGFSLS